MVEEKSTCAESREERQIAYFSMEIGIDSRIPTYSGGLGILAGDMIRSCADLRIPLVALTLLYRKGYFFQRLDGNGQQLESSSQWNPDDFLTPLPQQATVSIEGRNVAIRAWEARIKGVSGFTIPVLFLDTDLEQNSDYDRTITDYLYGDEENYRLAQEIVLGIGGVRMLRALNYGRIMRYHMNEGHSSLLALELLRERAAAADKPSWNFEDVRPLCVFTTHTPVPAGHDQFSYDLVQRFLQNYIPLDVMKRAGGDEKLNMTLLALNMSFYDNGVAKQHGKVSREMFPGYRIDSITNGVHSATWVCESFKRLYDTYMPGWLNDPFSLRYALSIPREEVWAAHQEAKQRLIDTVNGMNNVGMDYETLTIGFARRSTAYKRATLVFNDIKRLKAISEKAGKIQFVFAGKAHPKDNPGKELIKKIVSISKELRNTIKIVYLENYDMYVAKKLVSGVDVWLNTPAKPLEASGTSGMKAAHNGIPSLSILDGWWIEGCIENLTGWAIGTLQDSKSDDARDAQSLYDKLENVVLPTYYKNRQWWLTIMRHTIAVNASFFNTHRMVQQYVMNAYLY